jgi:oligopeptidase A
MDKNPLLDWDDLPPFDQIETQHIEPGIRAMLDACEQAVARLEETAPVTWRELMDPLEKIEDDLGRTWGIVSHLHGVKNSPELREVYDPLLAEVVRFSNRFGQSKALYQAYCALRDSAEARGFDPAQQRILESAIREAELNGVGLDDDDRDRYNEISQRLAELSTKFSNNVLDATKAFKVTLTKTEEVDGLPDTLLELAADTARQEGHERATASDGPWILTLDYPSFMPFMQHGKRRDLREKMYRAFISKASDGQLDNTDVAREIISLRIEKSRLLGFDTFAELSLSRKMATDAGSVRNLLDELRAAGRGA